MSETMILHCKTAHDLEKHFKQCAVDLRFRAEHRLDLPKQTALRDELLARADAWDGAAARTRMSLLYRGETE